MIVCSVCGRENDDLVVVCPSCGSYIQSKVETLDLFQTIWMLAETPQKAFKRILLARHKNYVLLLSSLLGVALVYAIFWYENGGRHFANVLGLAGAGLVIGIPAGLLLTALLAGVMLWCARRLGGKGKFRNGYAALAYAGVPIVLSLVLVFPLEIALFGRDFFDSNPPPLVINPVAYVLLLGFDALAVLWSLYLLSVGTAIACSLQRWRSVIVTLVIAGCVMGIAAGIHAL